MEYSVICNKKFIFLRFDKPEGRDVYNVRIANIGNTPIFWKGTLDNYYPVSPFDVMDIPEPYKGVLFAPRYSKAVIHYTYIGDKEPVILNDTLTGEIKFLYNMVKEGGKLGINAVWDNFGQIYGIKPESAKTFRILFSSELVKQDDFFFIKSEEPLISESNG